MQITGINMVDVKKNNRSSVLELLVSYGPLSRTDLATLLDLRTATLTPICADFLDQGVIKVVGKCDDTCNVGRKKSLLAINEKYKYILAVYLHYSHCMIVISDLVGNILINRQFAPELETPPAEFFHNLSVICKSILWEAGIKQEDILGLGMSLIGPVDQINGIAIKPFKLFKETNIPVKQILEKEFSFPVAIESNTCAFLMAMNLYENKSKDNLLAIKWGPGLGSASSINGTVCKNHSFRSSEVGHTNFYRENNIPCSCGNIGCLEAGVGYDAIVRKMQELNIYRDSITIDNIDEEIEHARGEFRNFLIKCSHDVAIGVSAALQISTFDKAILYGPYINHDYLYNEFLSYIKKINTRTEESMFIRIPNSDRNYYLGPIAVAIKNFLLK